MFLSVRFGQRVRRSLWHMEQKEVVSYRGFKLGRIIIIACHVSSLGQKLKHMRSTLSRYVSFPCRERHLDRNSCSPNQIYYIAGVSSEPTMWLMSKSVDRPSTSPRGHFGAPGASPLGRIMRGSHRPAPGEPRANHHRSSQAR